ncbi:hypothetical protein TrLO_g9690 [Triparma laevis f. longispina]|uniref:SET domain-containing protein n=1 Tax=Triparma laevis f. longispina TaxID=1714387 RepID=A0A9W7FHA8_9STRA|nr:hypothetical protein TrLO_g9690 [Triparma laevis f. longispina]
MSAPVPSPDTTTIPSLSDKCGLLPAFTVKVQIRPTAALGDGHCGIFASEKIISGTKIWEWTDLITRHHFSELGELLSKMKDRSEAQLFLRQGFVMPDDETYFCSNPKDAGRFINHSIDSNINLNGAMRDIEAGEELLMNYSFHGDPEWYQEICKVYGVLTEAQIAEGQQD